MIHAAGIAGLVTLVAGASAPAFAQAAASDCPAERARYTLMEDASFTAGFRAAEYGSDLYLFITSPKRTYWFTMGASMGHGGTHVSPIADPALATDPDQGPPQLLARLDSDDPASAERIRGNLGFYVFDAALQSSPLPFKGEPAPRLLFAPELTSLMWYEAAVLTGSDGYVDPDSMPRAFFAFSACEPEAAPAR